jgi:hypothetical protein
MPKSPPAKPENQEGDNVQKQSKVEQPFRPDDQGSEGEQSIQAGTERTLTRRTLVKTALAAATVGAAGGAVVMAGVSSAPAAALGSDKPDKSSGHVSGHLGRSAAPSVVFLRDAPIIAVDASLGDDFRVTLGGDRTMASPSHSVDGQKIIFQITQGAGGDHTIAWGKAYEFAESLPRPELSTSPGHTDVLGFIYNRAKGKWLLAAFVRGFAA